MTLDSDRRCRQFGLLAPELDREIAAERLSMRKTKELLRLDVKRRSEREMSRATERQPKYSQRYRRRTEERGFTWPPPPDLTESESRRVCSRRLRLLISRPLPAWKDIDR